MRNSQSDEAALWECDDDDARPQLTLLDAAVGQDGPNRLATIWPSLPPHVRETILTLAEVAGARNAFALQQPPVMTAAEMLLAVPPGRRPAVFTACVRFLPSASLDAEFDIGPIRAVIADAWETQCGTTPISQLRLLLANPAEPRLWSVVARLIAPSDVSAMALALVGVIGELNGRCAAIPTGPA